MLTKRLTRLLLAAAVVGAGFTGYTAGSLSIANAEPVRVEAPLAPGFSAVVEAVTPAVVSVRVQSRIQPVANDAPFPGLDQLPQDHQFRRFFGPDFEFRGPGMRPDRRERPNRPRPVSQGSGFFISDDGYLVTNNHVVEGGETFTIVMDDGTELDARLIGADQRTDLAVLKVDDSRTFTYVTFATDGTTKVGDWVVAVGTPFGLGGTVTAGIVSALGRDIGAGPYDDFIQIDAAVNRGNSGGPTFNLNGEVVGINTAIFSPSGGNVGIAFAVPASLANTIVNDLIDNGTVERGWLGVRIQPVTADIAESLGLADARGAIVADPQSDAPAAKAGIRAGDVITAVNGEAIAGPRELSRAIADIAPGTKVTVTLSRNGETSDVEVTLGELPRDTASAAEPGTEAPQAEPAMLDALGLTVVPAEDGQGVLVTAIEPGSDAADAGVRVGDIIRDVNNEAVASAADIERQIEEIGKDGRKAALLRLENDASSRFVAVPLPQG